MASDCMGRKNRQEVDMGVKIEIYNIRDRFFVGYLSSRILVEPLSFHPLARQTAQNPCYRCPRTAELCTCRN